RVAASKAEGRAQSAPASARQRVGSRLQDLAMLVTLENIRLMRGQSGSPPAFRRGLGFPLEPRRDRGRAMAFLPEGFAYNRSAADEYLSAFQDYGIDVAGAEPNDIVAMVMNKRIRGSLVTALDEWAIITPEERLRQKLWSIARAADERPNGLAAGIRK